MKKINKLEILVVLIDFISLSLSFAFASLFYLLIIKNEFEFLKSYVGLTYVIFNAAFFSAILLSVKKNKKIIKRNRVEELYNVIKNNLLIMMFFSFYAFISSLSTEVSRGVLLITFGINILVNYLLRNLTKRLLKKIKFKNNERTIIVSTSDLIVQDKIWTNVMDSLTTYFTDISIVDKNMIGSEYYGIPVTSSFDNLIEFCALNVVDNVLFILPNDMWNLFDNVVSELQSMGITAQLGIDVLSVYSGYNQIIEYVGNYPVISCAETFQHEETLIIKRGFDILGGIVGSIIAILATLIVGPIIKLESPGPIFFKQKRVGKNGRYFYIYKFRSMGVDAEARKQSLQNENEVEGHMFKMTNDPRVTRVGKFIRATSIDELPQFFNVLKGEMSLVGTRPPTIDEFKQYSSHHKRRLSMKPGITGMWQVSGRSDITDFEEVVRLDVDYIDNYTIGLDLKILAKTFVVVLTKDGSK